jgi:hypothetical protein
MSEKIKGQVTKIATTKDQCVRLTIDIEKSFIPSGVNLIAFQDQMINIELEEEESHEQ